MAQQQPQSQDSTQTSNSLPQQSPELQDSQSFDEYLAAHPFDESELYTDDSDSSDDSSPSLANEQDSEDTTDTEDSSTSQTKSLDFSKLFEQDREIREKHARERQELDKSREELQIEKKQLQEIKEKYESLDDFKAELAELAANDPASLLRELGYDGDLGQLARHIWNASIENEAPEVVSYRKSRELAKKTNTRTKSEVETVKKELEELKNQSQSVQYAKQAEEFQQFYKSKMQETVDTVADKLPAVKAAAQKNKDYVLSQAYRIAQLDAARRVQLDPNAAPMTPEEALQALEEVLSPAYNLYNNNQDATPSNPQQKRGITLNSNTTSGNPSNKSVLPDDVTDLDERMRLAAEMFGF